MFCILATKTTIWSRSNYLNFKALTATDDKLAQMMYLPLAEKMVDRMVNEGKMEAEAEVNIYLMILGYLKKHDKAVNVLDGTLGRKLTFLFTCTENIDIIIIIFFFLLLLFKGTRHYLWLLKTIVSIKTYLVMSNGELLIIKKTWSNSEVT